MKVKPFTLVVLFSCALFGQSWQTFVGKKALDPLPSGITITINHVPPMADWVVAVKGDSSQPPYLNATSAELGPATSTGRLPVMSMSDLPASFYAISRDSITLDLRDAPGNGFVVYAVVPPGLPITCTIDGSVVLRKTVQDSLMIRSGKVVNESASMLSRAVYRLGHPNTNTAALSGTTADLISHRSGVTLATADGLKRHLLSRPSAAELSVANCNCVRTSFVTIDVNESGNVVGIVHVGGDKDPAFQATVSSFVRRFVFNPFVRQDHALKVRAVVVVRVGRNGSVSTSLD